MKGHIRKRGKAAWSIILEMPREADGSRRQKWHTVHGTKKDAERELARLITEIETGAYVEPTKFTLAELLERWLVDYARPNVAGKTYERYAEIVRKTLIPALGHHPLTRLQPLHIQAFYSDMLENGKKNGKGGLSAQTVRHYHRVLHKALRDAVRWRLLARNPADAVEAPRVVRKEMKVLDASQVGHLLESSKGSRFYVPIVLAVATGLRRGEILALLWEDMDLDAGILTVRRSLEHTKAGVKFKQPKTAKSRRMVALPEMAIAPLKRHREEQALQKLMLGPVYQDTGLVCTEADGRMIIPDHLTRVFPSVVKRAGLPPIRFHDLRHTHATLMLQLGIHPKIVSDRLGHSTINLTMDTYSHVMPQMQEEAARKLNDVLRSASLQSDEGLM